MRTRLKQRVATDTWRCWGVEQHHWNTGAKENQHYLKHPASVLFPPCTVTHGDGSCHVDCQECDRPLVLLQSAVIEEKKFKYSPRGRQPIRVKMLMSTGRPHHFGHLLQV